MVGAELETIELQRADSGQDLWTAVEGAQYARLIRPDDPRTQSEAERMQDLIDLFSGCAEDWEQRSPADQAVALEQLGYRLSTLEELALFVHWGAIRGRVTSAEGNLVEVPIVILTISRSGGATIEIELPETIEAA